jgi:hypothetical protein
MNSNTVEKFHAAINSVKAAISALEAADLAVQEEAGGNGGGKELPSVERFSNEYLALCRLKDGLAGQLIMATAGVCVVFVEEDPAEGSDQREVNVFAVSSELPRCLGDGALVFSFQVRPDNTVCVQELDVDEEPVMLHIDGPAYTNKSVSSTMVAFSTREKADAWCAEHVPGGAVNARHESSGRPDNQHIPKSWW